MRDMSDTLRTTFRRVFRLENRRAAVRPGRLDRIPAFESRILGNARDVTVYLPPGYDDRNDRRYPVLYMQDGQNLFEAHRAFIPAHRAEALRRASWLQWMLPLLRVSVALVWIWTFAVSIGLYPRDQSLALLARVGASGAWAELLLDGAALFDLALGIGTLVLPAAWRARVLWPLQLALIAFYMAAISWAMPEFWLHPFGPLSKNLPMCAAIVLLWAISFGMTCRTSQCSTILPRSSKRKMSMPAQSGSPGYSWWQCSTTYCPSAMARFTCTRLLG